MVTSGAIALGMRVMELPQRPSSIDEMQAASAVGQGTLFRAYESRLAARDVHAAQVLLTSFDLAVRMHYLNARQALRKLLGLARGPGRQRERHHRHRRDHLRRQRLPLRSGRAAARRPAAGPAHRHCRACTPPTRAGTPAPGWSSGSRTSPSSTRYEIGDRTSPYGSGGMRSKVAAAEMASAAGIPAAICDGDRAGDAARRPAARRSAPGSRRTPSAPRRSSSGFATRSPPRAGRGRRGAARVLRERGSSLLPVGITGGRGRVRRRRRGRGRLRRRAGRQGDRNYSAAELARIKGMKSGRGARAAAERLRGGGAPRPLRARLSASRRPSGGARRLPLLTMAIAATTVTEACESAKRASRALATADTASKDRALERLAELLASAPPRCWRRTRPTSPTSAPRASPRRFATG